MAIQALLRLANAPVEHLSHQVYNVTSFNSSAGEIVQLVQRAFPNAQIDFQPGERRQGIMDTWAEQVDDSAAVRDWGWQPDYDLNTAFADYLIPTIRQRYV